MAKQSFAQKFKSLFGFFKSAPKEYFEELTDALIEGDVGAKNAVEIVDELEEICKEKKINAQEEISLELKNLLSKMISKAQIQIDKSKVNVFMVLGVNGVGKTTSVAKMAKLYESQGINVIMAASDTFRAAAVDQIALHGEKLGIRVVKHQMGSDPSAVVFDACDALKASGGGLVLADTAGRLHNKENLVNELKKIDRIAKSKADEGFYHKILVIDSTTGQNAVRQAEVFNEAVGIDAIVLTKYDSTAKGGCLISIGKELNIPILYVCNGEKYENISEFNLENYLNEFLGLE